MGTIQLMVNGKSVEVSDVSPTTTLLRFLRDQAGLPGTKEGCAEGDCGACTVAVLDPTAPSGPRWRAVNACLLPLPALHGGQIVTVEGLHNGSPHPVQRALTEHLGSQCGYCTPGVVMSMFEACYREDLDSDWKLDDQMCGNLCRCTGYRPIREAAQEVAGSRPQDGFLEALDAPLEAPSSLTYSHEEGVFLRPVRLDEVFDALESHEQVRFVAGATDLGLEITKRHAKYPCLVSLDGVPELGSIREIDGGWSIGATVRLSDLESWADEHLVTLARMLRFFGSRQIKHRATLGGNLCNASPIGDTPPVLLALDATVVLSTRHETRRVPLREFFLSYRQTAMRSDEVLVAVEIPRPSATSRTGSYKVSKRREMDISSVASSMYIELSDEGLVTTARFAYGGMAATPARASSAEAAVVGQPWNQDTVRGAMSAMDADFTPLSDHRGSAWYRATVAKNLLLGFFLETREASGVTRLPDHPSSTMVLR